MERTIVEIRDGRISVERTRPDCRTSFSASSGKQQRRKPCRVLHAVRRDTVLLYQGVLYVLAGIVVRVNLGSILEPTAVQTVREIRPWLRKDKRRVTSTYRE